MGKGRRRAPRGAGTAGEFMACSCSLTVSGKTAFASIRRDGPHARRPKRESPTRQHRWYLVRNGSWSKHPDPQVRAVIQLIFDKALRARPARLRRQRLSPHEHHDSPPTGPGHHRWVEATRAAIHQTLRNPAYAGIYVYGRTAVDDACPANARGRKRQRRTTPQDWVRIQDHHEPYIMPGRWTEIQERLARNQRQAQIPLGRGPTLVSQRPATRPSGCRPRLSTRTSRLIRSCFGVLPSFLGPLYGLPAVSRPELTANQPPRSRRCLTWSHRVPCRDVSRTPRRGGSAGPT
jgi:Recombinase